MSTKQKLANVLSQVPKKHLKQFVLLLKGKPNTEKFSKEFDKNTKLQTLFEEAFHLQDKWFNKLMKMVEVGRTT